MNTCFITARILNKPQRFLRDGRYITSFYVGFPNKPNLLSFAEAIAYGKISQNIFDLYFKGDYVIIEGKLIIMNTSGDKNLIINIIKLHPARIILKK
uniref:Putative single-stranded DNA binding protein n=1 Tax=Synarthrophyton chejuense TaxID=2485825 RepID=A0A3G3MFI6_9FLOR|nr:putative single-stranded DNA binding protein [Synarthrophyton chejuense]AYR05586.1 putative single-stranded DNA binding protein [Synarthrophyton chejuense]